MRQRRRRNRPRNASERQPVPRGGEEADRQRRRNIVSDANRRPRRSRRERREKRNGDERRPKSGRARNERGAKIVARLQPVAGTPGETYLRDVRKIDVSHWAIRRALEDVDTLGWCERACFRQPDPQEPGHELHGQWLGAIIAILTDPITGERTGGITRTYIHQGRKVWQGEVARRRRAAGDHPPVARRRGAGRAAHLRRDRDGAVGHVGPADELLPDVGGRLDARSWRSSPSSTASNA